ncbi:ABC transporter permease subunit [Kribbella sp. NBC_00709]|uniref:ABC transporter permease subunit n=1 Tax=Kribbella sp. NBC_00709 TaxID=2975972 RepID=UPI002E285A03|nr:ABC transporter permease subunit [Kribbella sp. NBC_00709]
MTVLAGAAAANAAQPRPKSLMLPQLRGEWRKTTTTKTWWLFALAVVVTTGLGLVLSVGTTDDALHHGGKGAPPQGFADVSQAPARLVATFAADIFTSGKLFGGMFATLMAVLLITNEYHHQTATTTFLAAPRRTAVVVAKFAMAMIAAVAIWALSTAIDIAVGLYYFSTQDLGSQLGSWTVDQAILVNLMTFALWGVFGIGAGVLLRSQTPATVITVLLHTVGAYGVLAVVALIRTYVYQHDSVYAWVVLYPAYAAQIAADPHSANLPGGTHVWWVGALVMLAYGIVMATVGTLILQRRDVS